MYYVTNLLKGIFVISTLQQIEEKQDNDGISLKGMTISRKQYSKV